MKVREQRLTGSGLLKEGSAWTCLRRYIVDSAGPAPATSSGPE
jgi:hypothetical protein